MTDRITPAASAPPLDQSDLKSLDFVDYIADMAKELETMCKAQDFDKLSVIFDLAYRESNDLREKFISKTEYCRQIHDVVADYTTS